MAEKLRRRSSKWDVSAEQYVATEIGHGITPIAKLDFCMDHTKLNSTKPIASMNAESSEIDQVVIRSKEEGDCKNCFKTLDWKAVSQDRMMTEYADNEDKPHDVAYDMPPGFEEGHQDLEPVSQDRVMAESNEVEDRLDEEAYDMPPGYEEMHQITNLSPTQHSNQFNLDSNNDAFMKQDWEPASQERPMTDVENQDMPQKTSYDMLPGYEEIHQMTPNISPTEYPKNFDQEGSFKEGLKKQVEDPHRNIIEYAECLDKSLKEAYDMSHILEDTHQRTHNMSPTQCSKLSHSVDGCRDGFNKQDSEPNPKNKTTSANTKNQDKPLKAEFDKSPLSEKRHRRTHNLSTIDDRSRSHRSRSRSRSRSASYVSRQISERRTDIGRTRGMTPACRDFSAGRCRFGSRCRYLHEGDGRRERDRRPSYGSRDSPTVSIEKNNRSQEKFSRRLEEHSKDEWRDPRQASNSNENCFDFTQGRCYRGESCIFVHQDASSYGGRERDESRGIAHDRKGVGSASLSHKPLCKFFLRGNCLNGDGCKFLHQVGLPIISAEKSFDSHNNITSTKTTKPHNQAPISSVAKNDPRLVDTAIADKQIFPNKFTPDAHKETKPSRQQVPAQRAPGLLSSADNPIPSISIAGQNAEHCAQNKFGPQLLHTQSFAQNPSFQQFVPPLAITRQLQQVMPSHPMNGQNQESIGQQIQQNIVMLAHGGSNFSLNGQAQVINNAQTRPANLAADIQQIISSNAQSQPQNNALHAHQPSPNPQVANSDENNHPLTNPLQISQAADSSASIAQKIVTSEQAAKITDLSASLAHFFGTAALNSQSHTLLNPNSVAPFALPEKAPNPQAHAIENVHQAAIDSSGARPEKIDAAEPQNTEEEGGKDGDGKKVKETKEIRLFKCSLIEFVKEMLKPKWKEGQLSKEAHKTIVKKVVDKVSGSLQASNIPHTQEKIDLYLSHSKAKLSKLVLAYVEKYVKS